MLEMQILENYLVFLISRISRKSFSLYNSRILKSSAKTISTISKCGHSEKIFRVYAWVSVFTVHTPHRMYAQQQRSYTHKHTHKRRTLRLLAISERNPCRHFARLRVQPKPYVMRIAHGVVECAHVHMMCASYHRSINVTTYIYIYILAQCDNIGDSRASHHHTNPPKPTYAIVCRLCVYNTFTYTTPALPLPTPYASALSALRPPHCKESARVLLCVARTSHRGGAAAAAEKVIWVNAVRMRGWKSHHDRAFSSNTPLPIPKKKLSHSRLFVACMHARQARVSHSQRNQTMWFTCRHVHTCVWSFRCGWRENILITICHMTETPQGHLPNKQKLIMMHVVCAVWIDFMSTRKCTSTTKHAQK